VIPFSLVKKHRRFGEDRCSRLHGICINNHTREFVRSRWSILLCISCWGDTDFERSFYKFWVCRAHSFVR